MSVFGIEFLQAADIWYFILIIVSVIYFWTSLIIINVSFQCNVFWAFLFAYVPSSPSLWIRFLIFWIVHLHHATDTVQEMGQCCEVWLKNAICSCMWVWWLIRAHNCSFEVETTKLVRQEIVLGAHISHCKCHKSELFFGGYTSYYKLYKSELAHTHILVTAKCIRESSGPWFCGPDEDSWRTIMVPVVKFPAKYIPAV